MINFKNKKSVAAFITAGDPTLDDTKRYIEILQNSGVDLIEVGIPFSDPIAEGAAIQEADLRALKNGVCPDDIFTMLEGIDKKVPFVFMSYANPVFFYGYEKFFARCQKAGVAGVILPDVPFEENGEIKEVAEKYNVFVADMVAPVSKERIQKICRHAQGFIYLLSDMGLENVGLQNAVCAVKEVSATPVLKEFAATVEEALITATHADGVIIGSQIVKIIAEKGNAADRALNEYVSGICAAVHALQ